MEIGFTGTRRGLNDAQQLTLNRILRDATAIAAAHHGDCVGADSQFHKCCLDLDIRVVLHPPSEARNRAYCTDAAEMREEHDYLQRDRHIVDASDCLIAGPNRPEKLRSGTWTTVRYARKCSKAILIIDPEGQVHLENGTAIPSGMLPKSWHHEGCQFSDCAVFWRTDEQFGNLSNMVGGFPLVVNGILIQSSEALYQALRFPNHPEIQQDILDQRSPMSAKMKAKKDSRREQFTRADWNAVRIEIMRWCLRIKLYQHFVPFLMALKQTGDRRIVEYSRKDNFWGATLESDWTLRGENQLGQLLEEVRAEALGWLADDAEEELLPVVKPLEISEFLLLGQPILDVPSDPFEDMQIPSSGFGCQFTPLVNPNNGTQRAAD